MEANEAHEMLKYSWNVSYHKINEFHSSLFLSFALSISQARNYISYLYVC